MPILQTRTRQFCSSLDWNESLVGNMRGKRSSMSFIRDFVVGAFNFVLAFLKTMFSMEAHQTYGNARPGAPTRPSGGVGRAPGSAAPRGTTNVHSLFDSSSSGSGVNGDHGNVHVVNSRRAWQSKVSEANAARKVIVVDFTASWCGPCKLMAPVFAELSRRFGQLIFVKVDVDEVQEVAAEYDVRAMPTFLFIKDGQQIDKVVGADRNDLERKCNKYATSR
ncbi:thioredoxin H4-1 isoform X1 [Physcomitrium patens]|uniref:thioredoxin H4-1 isoform X1 n=1 Tax=Physcomitrium patens TaxID=3218 RepID=UPI000D15CF24|nr:thioredoxin H9-like isoform X1 [Physcomitrium patens]|eukprot:XP_024360500.1 thioredoxin H9-like isoform X1 [Physcomitrella patens]